MPLNTQVYEVAKWLGVSDLKPTQLEGREVSECVNLYPRGNTEIAELYEVRGGSTRVASRLSPDAPLDGLDTFRIQGTAFLSGIHNGDVIDIFTGLAYSGGEDRFTYQNETNGVFVSDRYIMGDGVNQNVFVTADGVFQVMSEQVSGFSGSLVPIGSGGSIPAGSYTYRFAAFNFEGAQAQPSSATDSVTTTNNDSVFIVGIPQSNDPDVTGIGVFRSNDEVTWYLVGTATPGQIAMTDTMSQATAITQTALRVGANATSLNRMVPCRYFDVKDNRVFCAYSLHVSGATNIVYATRIGEFGIAPTFQDSTDNSDGFQFELPDTVTGLKTHLGSVATFTADEGYLLIGDAPSNFAQGKFSHVGCVAHRTIKSLFGFLIWLSPDGVYAYNNANLEKISDGIANILDAISAADKAQASAAVWEDRYYLFFPDQAWVFHVKYRQWTEYDGELVKCPCVLPYSATGNKRLFAAHTTGGSVYELEVGTTDSSQSIDTVLQTGAWNLGFPFRLKMVRYVGASWGILPSGSATIKVYRETGNLIQTIVYPLDTASYSGQTVTTMLKPAVGKAKSEHFALRIEASVDQPYQILDIGLHHRILR